MSRPQDLAPVLWEAATRLPAWLAEFVRPSVGALELRLLGRTIVLAAAVGIAGGLVGAGFVLAVDGLQEFLLDHLASASLLRAAGEAADESASNPRIWLLAILPALGGLVSGLLARFSPEVTGGGGDAAIEAFHHGAQVRPRVLPTKWLASVAALGTGGAGGREGPALHMGAVLGGLVGAILPTNPRERRILLVAGMAAGMAAVFRTPLGAALLAAEVLYRDDFEADGVVPAVIASVIAFATSQSILGQTPLFGRLPPHPFHAAHLPLYGGLAVFAALGGVVLVRTLGWMRRISARTRIPAWTRPAFGGLILGVSVVALRLAGGGKILGGVSAASALLSSGYGVAQLAITPSNVDAGWSAAILLLALAVLRIFSTGLTVGTGASAGDFAPSLVIGALLGGAWGHAAKALLGDPTLSPGAFALVGMGTLYAGIAHVPVSAVILVSELAGSYDLLVPLMLAAGGAHLALRRVSLYHSQAPTHARALRPTPLVGEGKAVARVRHAMIPSGWRTLRPDTPLTELIESLREGEGQAVYPVVDADGVLTGMVDPAMLLEVEALAHIQAVLTADVAGAPASVGPDDDLASAVAEARRVGLPQLPVCADRRVVGIFSLDRAVRLHVGEPPEEEALAGAE